MSTFSLKESDRDTIAAIATAIGEGGIGIVRLSGPQSIAIADKIFESKARQSVLKQKSFTAQYGWVRTKSGEIIDEVILLLMRAPKSYTCEDVVEISAHGGAATLQAILARTIECGARLAARGEFTKRAFLNGRLDLLQAEAVLDLVQAKTEMGRAWASSQLEGVLSQKIKYFKEELLDILSHLEASIDFPEDFPDVQEIPELGLRLKNLSEAVRALIDTAALGFVAKNGIKLTIAGRPNVGKSSLLNALCGESRVIVTPIAGTTRDVVEQEIELGGFLLRLQDTAGIHESEHAIEREGIKRSKKAVAESDLVLYVLDAHEALSEDDRILIESLRESKNFILVLNKSDLPEKIQSVEVEKLARSAPIVRSSCLAQNGLRKLEEKILSLIQQGKTSPSGEPVITNVRQKDLLEKLLESIKQAESSCLSGASSELIAVEVRSGLDALGSLAGEIVTDDLLEIIFNQFCIGK